MRAVIILLVVVALGGAAYVGIYHPDWIWPDPKKVAEEKRKKERQAELAKYQPAKTPEEAAQNFMKAIQNRDYEAAAKYVTTVSTDQSIKKDYYAEKLRRNHKAVSAMAKKIDELKKVMVEKNLKAPLSWHLLLALDPFPTDFKIVEDSLQPLGQGKDVYSVLFTHTKIDRKGKNEKDLLRELKEKFEVIGDKKKRLAFAKLYSNRIDPLMFSNGLMPPIHIIKFPVPAFVPKPAEIVSETDEDGEKSWKLKVVVTPQFKAELEHFLLHTAAYRTIVENLIQHTENTENLSPEDFQKKMIEEFGKQVGQPKA